MDNAMAAVSLYTSNDPQIPTKNGPLRSTEFDLVAWGAGLCAGWVQLHSDR